MLNDDSSLMASGLQRIQDEVDALSHLVRLMVLNLELRSRRRGEESFTEELAEMVQMSWVTSQQRRRWSGMRDALLQELRRIGAIAATSPSQSP